MTDRKAVVPEGTEAVYEKIRYAPAVKHCTLRKRGGHKG